MTALLLAVNMLTQDATLMARVVLGEDPEAPTAVCWVIRNRAAKEGAVRAVVRRDQFHGYDAHRAWPPEAMQRATRSALKVLLGMRSDPTGGATHFHRVGTPAPAWAPDRPYWRRFGQHWFYQERAR